MAEQLPSIEMRCEPTDEDLTITPWDGIFRLFTTDGGCVEVSVDELAGLITKLKRLPDDAEEV